MTGLDLSSVSSLWVCKGDIRVAFVEMINPEPLFLRPRCTVLERIGRRVNDKSKSHILSTAYANSMLLL